MFACYVYFIIECCVCFSLQYVRLAILVAAVALSAAAHVEDEDVIRPEQTVCHIVLRERMELTVLTVSFVLRLYLRYIVTIYVW